VSRPLKVPATAESPSPPPPPDTHQQNSPLRNRTKKTHSCLFFLRKKHAKPLKNNNRYKSFSKYRTAKMILYDTSKATTSATKSQLEVLLPLGPFASISFSNALLS
jgi:hypothetical protein